MGLETTVDFLDDLQSADPASGDVISQADDHMRNIKKSLKQTFPGAGGQGFARALAAFEDDVDLLAGADAAGLTAAQLLFLANVVAGTAANSKALVLDASGDIAGINELSATSLVGELTGNADTADLAADSSLLETHNAAYFATASGLSSEITDRIADVDAEETRALAAEGVLQTNIDAVQAAVIGAIYPVGALYIGTTSTNPNTILGIGVWAAFGQDRVMISAGGLYGDEATGGSKDAVNVSHGHADNFSIDSSGNHYHDIDIENTSGLNPMTQMNLGTAGATTLSTSFDGAHTHPISGSVTDSGVSGTNANLPPYIGVYMWKRTS